MENKVWETIKKYNMLSAGDTVVVGLSGGADSCALLQYLVSIREKLSLHIIACHVNHMIRGQEADRDEDFSRKLCIQLKVEFRLLKINVPEQAKLRKESTEKCARDIRYEFFGKIADEYNAKIATAHTASDNAETVLYNLARGCGIKGICGIPPVRERIIRPFITVLREETEKYCYAHNIHYVTDSTNLTDEYTRNKIRHGVIPVLKEINPAVIENISRMTENMRCNADLLYSDAICFLNEIRSDKYSDFYKANLLYSCDQALFAQIISILAAEHGFIPQAEHISLIREICRKGGELQLSRDLYAVCRQGSFRITEKKVRNNNEWEIPEWGQFIVISNKKIKPVKMSMSEFNNAEKNPDFLFINSGDCDTIPIGTVFRYRRSGDRFSLPERNISKTLKKLFIEMKIPAERRDSILVLAYGNDIIWIEGIGFSEKYICSRKTENVMYLDISEVSEKEKAHNGSGY